MAGMAPLRKVTVSSSYSMFDIRNFTDTRLVAVFMTNDVFQIDGAVSHLNDVIVLLPIYFEHKLIGWAANFGHLTDVQGKVPGSMSINAGTIYEDGLQIPIVKLYEKGKYNESLATVLFRNSRAPDWF